MPMTAKEYLRQPFKLDRKLRVLQEKVDKLRSALDYRSPSLGGTGGSSGSERIPDTISKIVEYEQRADKLRAEYVQTFVEVDKTISAVTEETLHEVLERRYLLYQCWDQIAAEMHYSERHIKRLHGNALEKVKMSLNVTL